jgi:hypothetical protein
MNLSAGTNLPPVRIAADLIRRTRRLSLAIPPEDHHSA